MSSVHSPYVNIWGMLKMLEVLKKLGPCEALNIFITCTGIPIKSKSLIVGYIL